jgi:serine/threonine-protein kinase
LIGQIVGDRYRVLRKIGEGGMGEVYLAEHIYIEKKVALKLLRAEVLSNPEAVARFRQEARSASSIGHENIIEIDDFGALPDGRVYMAMEYLEGKALNDLLSGGPLPLPRALDILIHVGRGLAAAHAKGITHRDMKPHNVFVVQRDGRDIPKILDFGIAKVTHASGGQSLTIQGSIFGTPEYMAPEQAMGGKMDHRVDIYAMGIILYEVFCGRVPFKADSVMGILMMQIGTPPTPPAEMAAQTGRVCPPALAAIIERAIQKNPADRFQTMNELVAALVAVAGGPVPLPTPPQPRRWPIAAGIGGAALVVGVLAAVWPRPGPVVPAKPDATTAAAVVPDARPAPTAVEVHIETTPPGAAVFVDGVARGTTPYVLRTVPGVEHHVRLELAKYHEQTLLVDGKNPQIDVRLVPSEIMLPE